MQLPFWDSVKVQPFWDEFRFEVNGEPDTTVQKLFGDLFMKVNDMAEEQIEHKAKSQAMRQVKAIERSDRAFLTLVNKAIYT